MLKCDYCKQLVLTKCELSMIMAMRKHCILPATVKSGLNLLQGKTNEANFIYCYLMDFINEDW